MKTEALHTNLYNRASLRSCDTPFRSHFDSASAMANNQVAKVDGSGRVDLAGSVALILLEAQKPPLPISVNRT